MKAVGICEVHFENVTQNDLPERGLEPVLGLELLVLVSEHAYTYHADWFQHDSIISYFSALEMQKS